MNTIEIEIENGESDLKEIVCFLLRNNYDVSITQDEFYYIIHFDFYDSVIADKRIAWVTEDELVFLNNYKENSKRDDVNEQLA